MSGERVSNDRAPIRVLAVDDHQLIRTGIATLLLPESDMNLVGEAANGRDAIVKFRECRPDVTLMDLQMPEMSGFDAIIAIRDEFFGARIIVLTTYAGDAQAQRSLKAKPDEAGGRQFEILTGRIERTRGRGHAFAVVRNLDACKTAGSGCSPPLWPWSRNGS
jgi:CheY-like chemotaxis protein